jgi:hypothetical protein
MTFNKKNKGVSKWSGLLLTNQAYFILTSASTSQTAFQRRIDDIVGQ